MSDFEGKHSKLSNNKFFAIVFRGFALLFGAWGVLAVTGVFKDAFNPVILLAYTIQSNILVVIFFGILLVKTLIKNKNGEKAPVSPEKPFGFFPRLSMVVAFAIFVTMLIYWFVLAPLSVQGSGVRQLLALENLAVHLITPLLMLVDYILFTKRGMLKKYDMLLCTVIPYTYLLEALTLGLTRTVRYDSIGNNSYYPYIFLDIDRFGARVILFVAAMSLFFLVIAFCWQRFDRRQSRQQ
ncbi:MAG: Pr6Pr family membrane protein [Spirochaetaceae bacterium]|nr:Pr6Pr family membrane protein [Spirochaetaceae bacterium]